MIKTLIYRILTGLSFLLGYLFLFLSLALLVAHKTNLSLTRPTAQWRPWFGKRWKYSTTLGICTVFNAEHLENVRLHQHELVHVRQFGDDALFFVLLAGWEVLAFFSPLWFRMVLTVPVVWLLLYVAKFLGAWLRHGHVYRDSEHERSAYAQTDLWSGSDTSWLDSHTSRPRKW